MKMYVKHENRRNAIISISNKNTRVISLFRVMSPNRYIGFTVQNLSGRYFLLTPLKTLDNEKFSNVFRGMKKEH